MTFSPNLDQMTPEQLRALAAQALQLQSQVEAMSKKIQNDQTVIEQLTYEIALLKRHKFAKRSEQISPAQSSLLDDLLDTDLEAIEAELKQLLSAAPRAEPRQSLKRAPLPPSRHVMQRHRSCRSSTKRKAWPNPWMRLATKKLLHRPGAVANASHCRLICRVSRLSTNCPSMS